MITKHIHPESFDFGVPAASLLPLFSKGIDKGFLEKRAAVFDSDLGKFQVKPGYTYVHLITTGAMERYGCFFKGQRVYTEDGHKNIEDIREGDMVLTHKGRYRKVLKTFVKKYKGIQTSIQVQNMPDFQKSTGNHPFRVLKQDQAAPCKQLYYRQNILRDEYISQLDSLEPSWVAAQDIKPGDHVYIPCKVEHKAEQLSVEHAYIFGYYLSEGCLAKEYRSDLSTCGEYKSIIFTMSDKDLFMINKLESCFNVLGRKIRISENRGVGSPYCPGGTKKGIRIQAGHKELALMLDKYFGHTSHSKFIHPDLFGQSEEWIKTFLAAYLDGDGHVATDYKDPKYENTIKFSTVSRRLALDLQRLMARVGVVSSLSLCYNKESDGCFGKGDQPIYSGNIGSNYSSPLLEKSLRLEVKRDIKRTGTNGGFQILPSGHMLMKVKEVLNSELETEEDIYNLEVDEDNSYVVDYEGHNSNSNADAFNKEARLHKAAHSYKPGIEAIMLDGGLKKYHNDTFTKLASVYKSHNNSHKGGRPSGYIVKAAYNDDMDRGELIVGLENDKWEKEIQKLAEEKPVFWSMACDVSRDLCSYCNHSASRRSDYCQHLKEAPNVITKEGHKICAINDTPMFHDISGVVRPADKIAVGLRKVANEGEPQDIYDAAPSYRAMRYITRQSPGPCSDTLNKLADIEKKILLAPAGSAEKTLVASFHPDTGYGSADEKDLNKLGNSDAGDLFTALKDRKVVLPFDSFMKVAMGARLPEVLPYMDDARRQLPGIFGRILKEAGLSDFLEDGSYEPSGIHDVSVYNAVDSIAGSHSLSGESVRARVVRSSLAGNGNDCSVMYKQADSHASPEGALLAREYARYVLAFADGLRPEQLDLTVAQTIANVR